MLSVVDKCNDLLIAKAVKLLHGKLLKLNTRTVVESPQVIADYMYLQYANARTEHFVVFFLDTDHGIISHSVLGNGTINHVSTYVREIAREGLVKDAAGVILCHNHPSYELEPSEDDMVTTNEITHALDLLDIRVHDHILIGKAGFISMKEEGLLYDQ